MSTPTPKTYASDRAALHHAAYRTALLGGVCQVLKRELGDLPAGEILARMEDELRELSHVLRELCRDEDPVA